MAKITEIKHRRGTAAQWTSTNPVLADGEPGFETDTVKLKFGNGTSTWTALPYFTPPSDWNTLSNKPTSFAPAAHSATLVTSGTLPDARLPARLNTVAQSITDWNNAFENGWVMGFNIANQPVVSGGWYIGQVVAHNSLYVTQTAYQFTSDSSADTKTYQRSSTDSAGVRTWGPWYKVMLSQEELDARYLTHTHAISAITGLQAALDAKEPTLAGGDSTKFLRGDKTWQVIENPVRSFAELQAAVAVGGTIRIDNNYPITVTSQLEVNVSCHIIGGNIILPNDAAYAAFNVNVSDVTFDTIRFTGGGTSRAYVFGSSFITAIAGAEIMKNINIKGCNMKGSQSENVRYKWVTHSYITDNIMDNFLYAGVMMLSCSDIKVSGNTITDGVMKTPVVNVYGIACTDSGNDEASRSKNITITGNTIRTVDWEGIDTHGGKNIIVTSNIIQGCPRGIAMVTGNVTRNVWPEDCIIADNYVDYAGSRFAEREGIILYGRNSTGLAYGTISGNRIRGYSTQDASLLTTYCDQKKTLVQGNTYPHVPWTDITLTNTAFWTANTGNKAQFMVEGRETRFRGMVISASSSTANSKIGTFPAEFAPDRLTFMTPSQGSNAASTQGVIGIYPNGDIFMLYRKNPGDFYSYPIEGTVSREITP